MWLRRISTFNYLLPWLSPYCCTELTSMKLNTYKSNKPSKFEYSEISVNTFPQWENCLEWFGANWSLHKSHPTIHCKALVVERKTLLHQTHLAGVCEYRQYNFIPITHSRLWISPKSWCVFWIIFDSILWRCHSRWPRTT